MDLGRDVAGEAMWVAGTYRKKTVWHQVGRWGVNL